MELTQIRKLVIAALFSDEYLHRLLVLKGGSALELVHRLINRGSVDIDVSISDEFDDAATVRDRIFKALRSAFSSHGFVLFDENFEIVPPVQGRDIFPWWGGYNATFKIISQEKYRDLGANLADLQRQALPIDTRQGRTFRIEISKHEYCRDKVLAEVNGQTIYVYSEEMCVFEKFRSICQQMPEYTQSLGRAGRARARDFYDIYAAVSQRSMDISLPENLELCESIFRAKHVPLRLLALLETTREFHRPDWDDVRQTVAGNVFEYDFYFDFVLSESRKLQSLWIE